MAEDIPSRKEAVAKVEFRNEQIAQFISRKPGLSQELAPVINHFAELGFSEPQLESILNVAYLNSGRQGATQKVRWFLQAIQNTYGKDHLESIPYNRNRMKLFLEMLNEVEELKSEMADSTPIGYNLCFDLVHDLGLERAQLLLDSLVDEDPCWGGDTRAKKSISAFHRAKELIDESRRTGYSPETLLNFRRGGIDKCFYSDDADYQND